MTISESSARVYYPTEPSPIWRCANCKPLLARRASLGSPRNGTRLSGGWTLRSRHRDHEALHSELLRRQYRDLPRPYWEALFPKAYWTDLRRYSIANGLDPYLVASLIRQESEFNVLALSRVSAVGLMQLMPKTGKTVAKQVKLKGYNNAQLFTPAINLELGTRYFKEMVDKYNGQFEYALAAYNAGTDRVGDWLGPGPLPRIRKSS